MAEKLPEMIVWQHWTEIVFFFYSCQLLLTSLFNRLTQEPHLDKKIVYDI